MALPRQVYKEFRGVSTSDDKIDKIDGEIFNRTFLDVQFQFQLYAVGLSVLVLHMQLCSMHCKRRRIFAGQREHGVS